jgi:hypothetical protein
MDWVGCNQPGFARSHKNVPPTGKLRSGTGTPLRQEEVSFPSTPSKGVGFQELLEMKPLRMYLAGKISKYDWRTTIVDGMGTPCGIDVGAYYDYVNEETRYPLSWEPYEQSIHGIHTYTGPY